MKEYSAYLAFGDSMSIDFYPAVDSGQLPDTPLGAAALLYKNHNQFWPAFAGHDLFSFNPALKFGNLAVDGATTWDLLDTDIFSKLVDPFFLESKILATLTLGGNDVLQMLARDNPSPARLRSEVAAIIERYEKVLKQLQEKFQLATIVLNTIYDPSDGSGEIPGYTRFSDKLPFLLYVNDQIREIAKTNSCLLADVHKHFFGHGLSAAADDRFYWKPNPIEPSSRGASELRSLWLATIKEAGLLE